MARRLIPSAHEGLLDTIARADEIRGLCAVVTKLARVDLQAGLDRHNAGISAIEHGVIRHLVNGIRSMAEISDRMGIARSTLVYVVDGLVQKKLVKRGRDPNDRRREPLSLEKKGRDLFDRVPKMDEKSVLVRSLLRMREAQQKQLADLLSRFVSELPGAARFQHQETMAGDASSYAPRVRSRGKKLRLRK